MSSPSDQSADPRLAKLRAGEPLEFAARPADREETPEEIAARTIPAKWLEDLAAKPARLVGVPVVISNAIISGALDLQYARFEYELSVTSTNFQDEADFSFVTFRRCVTFHRSRFVGGANFRAAHAEADFRIAGASFADGSNFQDLHVEELLSAHGTQFGAVNFDRIEVNKSAFFRCDAKGHRVTFGGDARFLGAHIQGDADFQGAEFKAAAAFDGIQVDGDAFFRSDAKGQRVTFGGDARFLGAHIQGDADFNGAEFKAGAAFDRIQVEGGAFFRSDDEGQRVTFGGKARFHGAHIQGSAEFSGAEFGGDALFLGVHIQGDADFRGAEFKAGAAFDRIQVDGGAFFRSDAKGQRVTFGGDARFHGAHIHGPASFNGAEFKAGAAFDRIQVDGGAFFRPDTKGQRVTFGRDASFPSAVFSSDAQFIEAEFKGRTDFDNAHFHGMADFESTQFASGSGATLIGARFERGAHFNSARFSGEVDFNTAMGARDVNFLSTQFSGPLSFREAHFQVVHFGKPAQSPEVSRRWLKKKSPQLSDRARFEAPVDLRGFTYDRIDVNLDDLFPKLATTDRQPYAQLEDALRKVGDDVRANDVYLERRRVERKRMFSERRRWRWFVDWLYMAVGRYGILPFRLVGYALFVVLLGALVFSRPGALEPKDKENRLVQTANTVELPAGGFARGLAVSVHQFLPVDVPVGADWVPASREIPIRVRLLWWGATIPVWPSVYATLFLRISGAILVGIGFGAITGLLRRVAR